MRRMNKIKLKRGGNYILKKLNMLENKDILKFKKKYKILELIEKGSQGKIFKGLNINTLENVAIKIYYKRKFNFGLKEYEFIKLLQPHKNIIKIIDFYKDEENLIIVFKYYSEDFYYYLNIKLNEETANKYFKQLINAVEYCHQNKIMHRDIKLENLLLDKNNNLILADFGLSCYFDKNSFIYGSIGTLEYMAPEIINRNNYKESIDIWSCGIVLFLFLFGVYPFKNKLDINFKYLKKELYSKFWYNFLKINNISKNAQILLQNMICVNPHKRIKLQEIKKSKWFTFFSLI